MVGLSFAIGIRLEEDMSEKQNCKYLIIIHMATRDIYWARYLKKKILMKDPNAEVRITEFKQIPENVFACHYKPDTVLTYTLRDSFSVNWMTALKLYTKARIVVYENEGLMNFDDPAVLNKRVGNAPRSLNLVNDNIYWGKKPAEALSRLLLERGYIRSVDEVSYCGYINYEMTPKDIYESLSEAEQLRFSQIENTCKGKKTILALTAFALCEYKDEQFKADGEILSDNEEEIHKYAENVRGKYCSFRNKYVKFLKSVAQKYSDSVLILKPHPAEFITDGCIDYYKHELASLDNVIIVENAILVGSLLGITNTVIHYGSTVSLESYIRGIPCVLFKDEDYDGNSELVHSTLTCTLSDCDDPVIDVGFKRFEDNDIMLEQLFNFKIDKPYVPSEEIISRMSHLDDTKQLCAKNLTLEEYNKKSIYKLMIKNMISYVKRGNLKMAFNLGGGLLGLIFS